MEIRRLMQSVVNDAHNEVTSFTQFLRRSSSNRVEFDATQLWREPVI